MPRQFKCENRNRRQYFYCVHRLGVLMFDVDEIQAALEKKKPTYHHGQRAYLSLSISHHLKWLLDHEKLTAWANEILSKEHDLDEQDRKALEAAIHDPDEVDLLNIYCERYS